MIGLYDNPNFLFAAAAARSGGEHGNKGEDAALAAIEMARLRVMDEVPF